jgi:methyl-accepting chemotaxis protein
MFNLRKSAVVDEPTKLVAVDTGPLVMTHETLLTMMDNMPINVMMADPVDLKINYINQTSIDTLKTVQDLLPREVDPENMMGVCIDVFHKAPSHQRQLLADPSNLPHNAKIKLGPETLDLRVSAVFDNNGSYLGAMVTWSVVTTLQNAIGSFEENVKGAVGRVSSASEEMKIMAGTLASTAEESTRQATTVAGAAEETTANVQTVASAAEEMSNSITEITRQVSDSSRIAQEAVAEAERTNATVQGLAEASEKIGEVVNLIQDIASQTNLLALNATIEAARAGEAGKGFAVVASEVKELSGQTAKATEEIATQIAAIQLATNGAVDAIGSIGSTIQKINEIAGAIAASVEQQSAATSEISRNVQEAATGTRDVSENISTVTKSATETGEAAGQVLENSGQLSEQADIMRAEVDKFLDEVKKL